MANRLLTFAVLSMALCASVAVARAPATTRVIEDGGFSDELSAEQRARIDSELAANQKRLARAGVFSNDNASLAAITGNLQWPLQPTAAFVGFGYHGISNFVDHDPRAPGFVQDYTCGTRTYDSANGTNHAGTDYYITPYPWLMMDEEQVAIVAAEAGTIIGKSDGNFDRDCAIDFNKQWNAVYIRHADGSVAWYGHMKSGTPTSKAIGAHVDVGERLGFVGSSGASSGPHLHFELHDPSGAIVDPRHGQCNAGPDLWAVFQPYEDSKINSLSTNAQEPEFADCGVDAGGHAVADAPHYSDSFNAGDTVHVVVSYRDQRVGAATHFDILAPDGSVADTWDFDLSDSGLPRPFYSGTAFSWTYALASDASSGTWQVKATFQNETYVHEFAVTGPLSELDRGAAAIARARIGAQTTRCRPQNGSVTPVCKP